MQYYKTLGIAPTASLMEIKKAYRKLVHQHHPDKAATIEASHQFIAIQQAYEILSNQAKRLVYDLHFFSGNSKKDQPPTQPGELLKELISLERKLYEQDPFRMNTDKLYFELTFLLSHDKLIQILQDKVMAETYLNLSLKCLKYLPFKVQERFINNLLSAYSDKKNQAEIDRFNREQQLGFYWDKYKFLIVLLVICGVCWWVVN